MLLKTTRSLARLVRGADQVVTEAEAIGSAGEAAQRAARQMRAELVRTKSAVENELVAWVLDCRRCGLRVHWVVGEGARVGNWAHAEPAADHRPVLS